MPNLRKIVVIGAGWYGVHTALELKSDNPHQEIVILDKEPDIFRGISGMFGIRLHAGPHYPRSQNTRKDCQLGLKKFKKFYPELMNDDHTSLYLLGKKDSDGCEPKVTKSVFKNVCEEYGFRREIEPEEFGFTNVEYGAIIDEPTAKLGQPLRIYFKNRLLTSGIPTLLNFLVLDVEQTPEGMLVNGLHSGLQKSILCDVVIHANSYQSLLPKELPFSLEMVYQPCLGLQYRYIGEGKPIIFIIMDGAYPCLMPMFDAENSQNYVMTHGKWTILGTFTSAATAHEKLHSLTDFFVETIIKKNCESEMKRFYESFFDKFEYIGWKGVVLAKPAVASEFRSAVTFRESNIIYITPGKITNIFEVADEVKSFLATNHCKTFRERTFSILKDGIFERALPEIFESTLTERSTTKLQPYKKLLGSLPKTNMVEINTTMQRYIKV